MSSNCRLTLLGAVRRRDPIAADALIAEAAEHARAAGMKLAGVLQRDTHRPGRRRCDIDLVDLGSGRTIRISEDRGNWARGCRLDASALAEASEMVEVSIVNGAPDLVILNKFGKAEREGGGMRGAMGAALSLNIPVLTAVGEESIPALEIFAGDLFSLIDADPAVLDEWLQVRFGGRLALTPRRRFRGRSAKHVID